VVNFFMALFHLSTLAFTMFHLSMIQILVGRVLIGLYMVNGPIRPIKIFRSSGRIDVRRVTITSILSVRLVFVRGVFRGLKRF
jgi:hypothetical protein